jgi:nitroreductase
MENPGLAADSSTYDRRARYDAFMEVVRDRKTSRLFEAGYVVPREHYELILEAARHAPSGANTQPWHYIVITSPETKRSIADYFVEEQRRRAKLRMKFPTPNYRGLESAPGMIVIATDFRWTRAFPVLNDGSELDRLYHANAERILLQSVAASTMAAHLAATALGYGVWWVTAIGQENAQKALKPLLGVPEDLAVIDIFCFGPPAKDPYKRWKKTLGEIVSWERFDMKQYMTLERIDAWIHETRHKVMYRDESRVD